MINNNGGDLWGYRGNNRLIVPERHAAAQTQAPVASQATAQLGTQATVEQPSIQQAPAVAVFPRQAVYRPVCVGNNCEARVEIKNRTMAGATNGLNANYTSQPISPMAQLVAQSPVSQSSASGVEMKVEHNTQTAPAKNDVGFMPTTPVYSPDAIPAKRAQTATKKQVVAAKPQSKPAQPARSIWSGVAKQARQPIVKPELDREAVLRRAEEIRRQAQQQAEARAKAEAEARANAARQQQLIEQRQREQLLQQRLQELKKPEVPTQSLQEQLLKYNDEPVNRVNDAFTPVSPVSPISLAPQLTPAMATAGVAPVASAPVVSQANVNASMANNAQEESAANETVSTTDTSEPIAVAQPQAKGVSLSPGLTNFFNKLAGFKININFKINKERVATFLRYLAVIIIIATSAYLAWDTYNTNQQVKDSFNGGSAASAMSISGTNPATADQTAISEKDYNAYTVPADQPRYITIPAIGVNARVKSVGVNSKGNIDTPSNLNDTAWYDGSAKPGQEGEVFIDGHTSFSNSISAAFNKLPELKAGDAITIEKGDGEKINYTVTSVETVNAEDVDMGKALNPPDGAKKGLTLMTCTGTFNYRTQTADKRLIVYAVQDDE